MGEYVIVTQIDGSIREGMVTSIDDDCFMMLSENSAGIIAYSDITQLRCQGTASITQGPLGTYVFIQFSNEATDANFICKRPFLRNEEEFDHLYSGVAVTFEPGMDDRGLIAKDVVISGQGDKSQTLYEGIGVVLTYQQASNNNWFGFIGNEYCHPAYNRDVLKAEQLPRGFVRFDKMDSSYDPRLVYIVSYSCASKPDLVHLQNSIGAIKVIKTFDKKDYANVCIREDGTVFAIPASVAYIPFFLNRARNTFSHKPLELGLTKTDDTYIHGILLEYDELALRLLTPRFP